MTNLRLTDVSLRPRDFGPTRVSVPSGQLSPTSPTKHSHFLKDTRSPSLQYWFVTNFKKEAQAKSQVE